MIFLIFQDLFISGPSQNLMNFTQIFDFFDFSGLSQNLMHCRIFGPQLSTHGEDVPEPRTRQAPILYVSIFYFLISPCFVLLMMIFLI